MLYSPKNDLVIYMSKILKLFSVFTVLLFMSSCTGSDVIKTKEITDKITQTKVVTKNEDDIKILFDEYFSLFNKDFIIPGLYEGFIPQGICYDLDSSYIISGYYEDAEFPSMIICVDYETGEFIKALALKNIDGTDYFGHAGGIACSGDYIFITSDNTCHTIKNETINSSENGSSVSFESKFKITTKGSFAGYNEGVLWIGDFIENSDKEHNKVERVTTLQSGETFYAYCEGYILEDNLPSVEKINNTNDGYIPDYYLAIPDQVQGVAFTKTEKIVFSTSYGRKNNSIIYVYDDVFLSQKVGVVEVGDIEIDLLACSSDLLSQEIIAPPMTEGITSDGDELCIIFESGAEKYRNHRGKYPLDNAYKAIIE